ncbi:MAG TPA: nuclear transport factor 2 family protein [Pyrinomonadaceae bacterium]|nr:nuclear transport factor 2 family protein [Pyrinomonadaceae bacterium]
MNSRWDQIVLCAVLLALPGVYGCNHSARETARATVADTASERANARKALDSFFLAVDKKDWKTVNELLADDFQFFGDDLTVLNRSQFIDAMRTDDMKIDKLDLKDITINLSPDETRVT